VFEGVFTALVTPFSNGVVDEEAFRKLIELQIEAGIHGLVPCGSTGESATLSHHEHRKVVELTIEAAAGRVPVIAGTGSNSTSEAVAITNHAREAGADGALLISPYYNKPTQEGLVAHYETVARETGLPIIVYNIPGRTGSNITASTQVRLAEVDGIVGVKEASGDIVQMSEVIANVPDDFSVLSGDDAITLPLMAVGGKGVISTSSNLVPERMVALYDAFQKNDLAEARRIHEGLLPLFDLLFCETNPIPIKAAQYLRGLIQDEIRLPLLPMTDGNMRSLEALMKEMKLL
jgi:4-hydroxy-tetrahydrodipicolinate synthase